MWRRPGHPTVTDADDPLLAVEDLTTVFHTDRETVRAVDGVSLTVERGETVGLVGESGSGKSVTARSIMGLVESPGSIESGSVRLDGEELVGTGPAGRDDAAMVFQDPEGSLNPVYTVGNQLREALRIHQGLRGRRARAEAVELLESVGIPDAERRVDEYPHEFSGGMQQRAVIALALACDPDLLIADEPTTALDVTIQAQILDLLDGLQHEQDLGILFITHDMGVIEETADRVNVMYAGEIVERAPVDTLFASPAHPYTRGLLASLPGRAVEDRLPTIDGEVPTPTGPATDCRFAPRCPHATAECETPPPTVSVGPDHEVDCVVYDDGQTTLDTETGFEGVGDPPVAPDATDAPGDTRRERSTGGDRR